jgi:hypothetical protein
MDNLTPVVAFVVDLRMRLENGESLMLSLKKWITTHDSEWEVLLRKFTIQYEQGTLPGSLAEFTPRIYQLTVLELLRSGLMGEPVLSRLVEVEEEMLKICENDIDQHVALLPIISLLPLLIFMVPALLILFFGPLLHQLVTEVL